MPAIMEGIMLFVFQSLCIGGTCLNTDGGFKCECLDGFTLGPDGRTCTDSVQVGLGDHNSQINLLLYI